jgi:hypothetical protein
MSKVLGLGAAAVAGFLIATLGGNRAEGGKNVPARVFEMRTYYAHPGKMQALHERFRKHTCKLFEKHGMTLVGFWSPIDQKEAENKMVYILAFPSRAAAKKAWDGFRNDPDWKTAKDASEKDGPLVAKVESVYLNATDYSPVK